MDLRESFASSRLNLLDTLISTFSGNAPFVVPNLYLESFTIESEKVLARATF